MIFREHVLGYAGLVAGLMLLSTDLACAQAVGVLERERPAYDAKGIPLGGFRLYPRLNFDTAYDDNVFRLPAAQTPRAGAVSYTITLSVPIADPATFVLTAVRAGPMDGDACGDFTYDYLGRRDLVAGTAAAGRNAVTCWR